MNPNSFRFRLITLDEVSMPVGNGQIVGLQPRPSETSM